MPQTVAITGATGYLGGLVERTLSEAGCSVLRLGRRCRPGSYDRAFFLGEPLEAGALTGVDLLIHAAYDLQATDRRSVWATNVEGSRRLFAAARHDGVARIMFVSSMSAYAGTRQLYGRSKLACELDVLQGGGVVVRPGLVYGPGAGGMSGALAKIAHLPVLPLLGGRQAAQYTCHCDDFSDAVLRIADAAGAPSRPLGLAHPQLVQIQDLITGLGARKNELNAASRRQVAVPLPWRPVYGAMLGAARLGLPMPFRPDSVLGLVRQAPGVPEAAYLAGIGVGFRPFGAAQDC